MLSFLDRFFGMAPRRLKHAAKLLIVNLAVLLAGALLIELTLGTWIFGNGLGALNVNANVHRTISGVTHYQAGTKAYYSRDAYGLRGDYGKPADITILTVGGSTTNERNVGQGETWSDVLQAEMQRRGQRAEVANAGVDGHSTAGHIRSFEIWFPQVPGLKPHYVLVMIGVNERGVEPGSAAQSDSITPTTRVRRLHAYVENNSIFVRGVRIIRGWHIARSIGVQHGSGAAATPNAVWVPGAVPADLAERLKPRLDGYERRLALLHAKITALGAVPVYVTQINGNGRRRNGMIVEIAGSGGGAIFAELSLYNARLLAFCARVNAACIDVAGHVDFVPGDFYDSVHTTPSGSRKIGRFVAESMADRPY